MDFYNRITAWYKRNFPDYLEAYQKEEELEEIDHFLDARYYINSKLFMVDWRWYKTIISRAKLDITHTAHRTIMFHMGKVQYQAANAIRARLNREHGDLAAIRIKTATHIGGHVVMEYMYHKSRTFDRTTVYQTNRQGSVQCFSNATSYKDLRNEEEVIGMIASHLASMIAEKLLLGYVNKYHCQDIKWITVYSSKLASICRKDLLLRNTLRLNSPRITLNHWIEKGFNIAHNYLKTHIQELEKVVERLEKNFFINHKDLETILGPQVYDRKVVIIEQIRNGENLGYRSVK